MFAVALGRKRANYKLAEYCVSRVSCLLNDLAARSGEASVISLADYRALYNLDDESTRKNKKAAQRACVDVSCTHTRASERKRKMLKILCLFAFQLMGDLISNTALHSYCKQMTELGGTCYRYTFEHYNPLLTSAINIFLPFIGETRAQILPLDSKRRRRRCRSGFYRRHSRHRRRLLV